MSTLAIMALGIGAAAVAGKWPGLTHPAAVRAWLQAFPRHRLWGRVLAAVDLAASAWLVWDMPESCFTPYRQSLWILAPASGYLVWRYLDELLAPRALGGLLLLVAAPVLDAARFHPSPWRLVMVTMAYLWVVAGLVLVSNPGWFRKWPAPLVATDRRIRLTATAGLLAGLGLVVLGLTVY